MFKLRVPATSANMGPGFDTAGIALGLYNYLEVWTEDEKTFDGKFVIKNVNNIDLRIEAGQHIPTDQTNLIYSTICWFAALVGKPVPRIYMRQTDEIPLARGLGSSAACIVAGLITANKLLDTGFTTDELCNLAVSLEGHPDNVAPAFYGSMVVGASEEDRFEHVKIPVSDEIEFIALIPDFPLSTTDARAVLPRAYTKEQAVFNVSRVALMVSSMMSGNFNALSIAMQDEIHQPYRKILIPGMEYLLKKSVELGCYGSYLSGAGPTLMLMNKRGNEVIEPLKDIVKSLKNYWLIKPLEVDKEGAKIIS